MTQPFDAAEARALLHTLVPEWEFPEAYLQKVATKALQRAFDRGYQIGYRDGENNVAADRAIKRDGSIRALRDLWRRHSERRSAYALSVSSR